MTTRLNEIRERNRLKLYGLSFAEEDINCLLSLVDRCGELLNLYVKTYADTDKHPTASQEVNVVVQARDILREIRETAD